MRFAGASTPSSLRSRPRRNSPDLTEVLGQARATEAIRFGIGIRRSGYNLFVLGPPGTGRHVIARRFIEERAAHEAPPFDWCYVHNFEQPHKPRASLPAGMGVKLRRDMERLLEDLRSAIPAAFESEEYRARRQEIEASLKEKNEQAFDALRHEAESHDIALIRTPGGMAFAPTRKGEVVSPAGLRETAQGRAGARIEAVIATLQEQLERLVHQVPQWRRETQERIRELDRQMTRSAVGHLIEELKKTCAALPEVLRYLETAQQAVIDNVDDFRRTEEGPEITFLGIPISRAAGGAPSLRRYQVNVLIDTAALRRARRWCTRTTAPTWISSGAWSTFRRWVRWSPISRSSSPGRCTAPTVATWCWTRARC